MSELRNYDAWLEGAFDRPARGNSPYNVAPAGAEDTLGSIAGVPDEDGWWDVGKSRVRLPSGSLGTIMTDHLDETYTVQLEGGGCVHVGVDGLVEVGEVTDCEEEEPDVEADEADEDGHARAYGGGMRYEVTLGNKRRVWVGEHDLR